MNRLLALELNRLVRQTSFWIIGILIFVLGGFNVLVANVTAFESPFDGSIVRTLTSRSIIESSFQLGQFQVLLIGVLTSLFIATDISQGTIRNKLIAGYSKFEVYIVQMIISIVITMGGLFLFHALPLVFIPLITFPIGVDDGSSLANFFLTIGFGYFLVIVGVVLTTWIAMKAKNTAGAIIFTILIFVLGPTVIIIAKTVTEAMILTNIDQFSDFETFDELRTTIDGVFEWIYFYQIQRLNGPVALFDLIEGNMGFNFFSDNNQSYIWKTLLSNTVLLGLLIGVGGWRFSKSDLR
jgi:hypothetical protein